MTLFRLVTDTASLSPLTLYGGEGDAVSVVLVKRSGPTNRYLLSETTASEVPFCVIVINVFGYHDPKMPLTQSNDVVETLLAYRKNESFHA